MKTTGKKIPVDDWKRFRSGTTLVEVILAIVIIAILAVVAVGALMYPTHLVVSDARRQIALHEAGRDMERVRALPYSEIYPEGTNYDITALSQTLDLTREVEEFFSPDEKIITVQVADEDGDLLVELITERTP